MGGNAQCETTSHCTMMYICLEDTMASVAFMLAIYTIECLEYETQSFNYKTLVYHYVRNIDVSQWY